jgi:hypothetical protein
LVADDVVAISGTKYNIKHYTPVDCINEKQRRTQTRRRESKKPRQSRRDWNKRQREGLEKLKISTATGRRAIKITLKRSIAKSKH